MTQQSNDQAWLTASPRALPLARTVDVVVLGGTVAAVAAATAAAARGARVLLAAPRLYLGEDRCATLDLCCASPGPDAPLAAAFACPDGATTPLRVKRTLAEAVVAAGVETILGAQPVGLLRDADGRLAGVVLADRAGRQAVAAGAVVDATRHGLAAQLLGAAAPADRETTEVRRIVFGGADGSAETPVASEDRPGADALADATVRRHVYAWTAPVPNDPAGWAALEADARDRTFRPGQLRAGETVLIDCPHPACDEAGLYALPWSATEAEGRSAGQRAAEEAARPGAGAMQVDPHHAPDKLTAAVGDVVEPLRGFRPTDTPTATVTTSGEALPVLAEVDVLVVGGGTAGAAAAIGAARDGARVLVIEFQEALGGVGTVGLITRPYHGISRAFAAEVPWPDEGENVEDKMEWLRRALRDAGGTVWFGSFAWGAVRDGGRIAGAAVATPQGHGAVLAQVVIDATGNADLAAAAGVPTRFGADATDIATQGIGLGRRPLGEDYVNSDCLLVDDSDVIDVSRAMLGSALGLDPEAAFDLVPLVQSRERRRIVGEHTLSYLDQLLDRRYPDTIAHSRSDYDSHGYPSLPYFALLPHTDETRTQNHPAPANPEPVDTPFRALLPVGLEGLLVIGLGTSMHRDGSAMMRMQPDLLNQGYAAGLAAATAASAGTALRALDMRTLQRRLVDGGFLEKRVLTDAENFPPPVDAIADAVQIYADPANDYAARSRALALLFLQPDAALPALRSAWAEMGTETTGDDPSAERALALALVLGILGDASGAVLLAEALDAATFDAKILQGHMAEYAHLPTPVDALILALAGTGDARALPCLLRKLDALDAETTLSHHRSLALALERVADPAAAKPLADLLARPGLSGHAQTQPGPLWDHPRERRIREPALREIVLARALFRCGDWEGRGRAILEAYRTDLRGHLAAHAAAVLQSAAVGSATP